MKFFIAHLFLLLLISPYTHGQKKSLKTVFENTEGKQTGTYEETIQFYKRLSAESPYISIQEVGETDSGFPLHLVLFDTDENFDLEAARSKGKTIILINNGIHPGEPDGIEASEMLLRDYATNKRNRAQLKDVTLAIIPLYNIGGALKRGEHSRANQNGPKSYGFRGNARNYDLNRDFIKADSKNARAFYKIYQMVLPDIFIDTHVSNGADYQYSITHLATQHNKLGKDMGGYLHEEFTPALEQKMREKKTEITPYVNVYNTTPDAEGIIQFMDYPRYSTGYTTLFNTLGFMIETHMLKPFDVRVKATYNFLESVIEIAIKDGKEIQQLHHSYRLNPGDLHYLDWEVDKKNPEMFAFKGYEGEMIESKFTGQKRLFYDRKKPFTKEIPYYTNFKGTTNVIVPKAYVIPQGWHEVIDRLKWSDIDFSRFENDTVINVETYRIQNYTTASKPYEGHYRHSDIKLIKDKKNIDFRKGDYIFYINQPGGRFLIETLEPQAPDSYFSWNFFDTILQQKEHFSPYVFEDIAYELLQNDAQLKDAFEKKKKEDEGFASSSYSQLSFIYEHSPYYEEAHLNYPIYRLVD
ncbi:M14 family metallopeptidase [Fulvivirga sediminis]|uniref:M14 family metallopeptidase n=1 Tax=Fulvivirga sediminis TaxID=2803949 RepID=A0A937F1R6_9BACT|nr:M14 family metallopeptidase [Fulvivirga sediminis]MBL3654692.1 M14 family metallopeptidase [Fulvivirga sediminis]